MKRHGNGTIALVVLLFTFGLVACSDNSAKQKAVATDALKALRKMDTATDVGVSYMQYGPMLIEAKTSVNDALSGLPDGQLKDELNAAIEAYSDANTLWRLTNNEGIKLSGPLEGTVTVPSSAEQIVKKYHVPDIFGTVHDEGNAGVVSKQSALSAIWKVARSHIDTASSLIAK
ncbi:MAG: hypothetical protein QOG23_2254 [Blastocatellia bacterium]|jgi:hypothetical protein|nr:hypothetical protein [Blastocatellia bacterium]